jgi:hypothetical protein
MSLRNLLRGLGAAWAARGVKRRLEGDLARAVADELERRQKQKQRPDSVAAILLLAGLCLLFVGGALLAWLGNRGWL